MHHETIAINKIRVGSGAAKPLDSEEIPFYLEVSKRLGHQKTRAVQTVPVPAIAVQTSLLNLKPLKMQSVFAAAAEGIPPGTDIVVVDLEISPRAGLRGAVIVQLTNSMKNFITSIQRDPLNVELVILLMPESGVSFQEVISEMGDACDSGKLVIIASDGGCHPASKCTSEYSPAWYLGEQRRIRGTPIQLLERKLIGQLGHFVRSKDAGNGECVRFFFDGRKANEEIKDLVTQYLRRQFDQLPDIICHQTISQWLVGPLSLIASDLGINCNTYEEVLVDDAVPESWKTRPPLIVVPLVDSGSTVKQAIGELRKTLRVESIKVLSILSTSGDSDEHGTRILDDGTTVHYLLRVHQHTYSSKDSCPMCSAGLEFSEQGQEKYSMFTSYDYWEMVNDVGLIPEIDVPENRAGMQVPAFPVMIEKHGAWIALKIENWLRDSLSIPPSDVVAICPDEKGSQTFAARLREVSGITVILVPRDIINEFRNCSEHRGKQLIEEFRTTKPDWYIQLDSSPAKAVVVMDEFNVSGGTRNCMERLLRYIEQEQLCYLCLVDFGPTEVRDKRLFALYEYKAFGD